MDKEIVRYETLQSYDGPQDSTVGKMIADGWQPYGLPTNYYVFSDRFGCSYQYWAQTMVRYAEQEGKKLNTALADAFK